jgi:hypothetical protein
MSKYGKPNDAGTPVDVLHACEHRAVLREPSEDKPQHYTHLKDGQAVPPGCDLYSIERQPSGEVRKYLVHRGHKGPSRANTAGYRRGYDAIFGKRPMAQA